MTKLEVTIPSMGESISEVTIAQFLVPEGSQVAEDQPVLEIESDKATLEVPSPGIGKIAFQAKEGDTVAIGAVVGIVDTEAQGVQLEAPLKEDVPKESAPKVSEEPAPPTSKEPAPQPAITGQLRQGTEEYLASLQEPSQTAAPPSTALPQTEGVSAQRRERMPKIRKVIAKRLVEVKNETALLTTFNEVDMSAIQEIRKQEKEAFLERNGVKLTFLPFFIQACAVALREFPHVNAFFEPEEIVYNEHAHIGIAVSTPAGLVVPVIRNVDQMGIVAIAKSVNELALQARDKKLRIEDMSGGTFTITNGGVFGSMLSTPILNPPQSAILGMHNITERPVVIDGQITIRPIMYLALSYDHRIIDGKDSVLFLCRVKEILENPTQLLLR